MHINTVSPQNVTTLSLCNSELILIIFGTNVIEKVGNQKVLYFPTSLPGKIKKDKNSILPLK